MKWLTDMVTDYDGTTFETGRLLATLSILVLLFLAVWDVVVNRQPFSAMTLGGGIAAVFGSLGVYLMGDKTKPEDKKSEDTGVSK